MGDCHRVEVIVELRFSASMGDLGGWMKGEEDRCSWGRIWGCLNISRGEYRLGSGECEGRGWGAA